MERCMKWLFMASTIHNDINDQNIHNKKPYRISIANGSIAYFDRLSSLSFEKYKSSEWQ